MLRFWLEATRSRPVRVLLEESNRSLAVYGPPFPLAALVGVVGTRPESTVSEASPLVAPALAASAEAMELSEPAFAPDVAEALVAELTAESAAPPPFVVAEPCPLRHLDHTADFLAFEQQPRGFHP